MAIIVNAQILNVGAIYYIASWNNDSTLTLICCWRHYNDQFRREEHSSFWNQIARQIREINNLMVTGNQCRSKWASLKQGYENMKIILSGNPNAFPVHSPIYSYDCQFHNELSDEFWIESSNYLFIKFFIFNQIL